MRLAAPAVQHDSGSLLSSEVSRAQSARKASGTCNKPDSDGPHHQVGQASLSLQMQIDSVGDCYDVLLLFLKDQGWTALPVPVSASCSLSMVIGRDRVALTLGENL